MLVSRLLDEGHWYEVAFKPMLEIEGVEICEMDVTYHFQVQGGEDGESPYLAAVYVVVGDVGISTHDLMKTFPGIADQMQKKAERHCDLEGFPNRVEYARC